MGNTSNQYNPTHVSPPGETILETLKVLGMSQAELAIRTGRPRKTINEIIRGKAAITPTTALQLERVLGIPASFWNNYEKNYREYVAQKAADQRLQSQISWLNTFPVNHMVEFGWISKEKHKRQQLDILLSFFGVASPGEWEAVWRGIWVQYRRSNAFSSEWYATTAWLRRGELQAQQIPSNSYDEDVFMKCLSDIKACTMKPVDIFVPEMTEICARAGVAVVFVPGLPKTRISGATRWLNPNMALVQLSLRYKTDDHLWFTFYHEAGHIMLHGKKQVFLEGTSKRDEREKEADRFAADFLIDSKTYRDFCLSNKFSGSSIRSFAARLHIAPGIVVGRLQHDKIIPYTHFNYLKRRFDWSK
jgi:addiction module HigA family antidote